MRTIYVDSEHKCHVADDGTMTAVESEFFVGKCDEFVEGYCIEITDDGQRIYPWRDYSELESVQREYERALIVDMQNALNKLGVTLGE